MIVRENLSNENLIIELATEPKPKDKCGRSFFKRRDKFHIEHYNNLYKESKGTYSWGISLMDKTEESIIE